MARPGLRGIAWRNLWRNKRRTLLTLAALAFGGLLTVLMTSMQDRSFSDMIDTAAKLGGGHAVVQHVEYLETPTLTRTVQRTDAIREAALAERGVNKAVDRITGQALLSTARNNAGILFTAFDPKAEDETSLSFLGGIQEGSLLGEGDDDRGIVLGVTLARNLNVGLGDKVVYMLMDRKGEIVASMARVSGIVKTGAESIDAAIALLPIDRVRDVLGYGPAEATQVALFLDDYRDAPRVVEALGARLPASAKALTWHEVQPELSGFIAMKVGGGRFMELVLLVLVAASVFNTLFVSVMERMREFGILRAIGYSPGQIFLLVMWESLWLGVVGLLASFLVTVGPYLYLSHTGIDMSAQYGEEALEIAGVGMSPIMHVGIFPINAVAIAIVLLTMTLLAGVYPAWKAGRVQPVEAIKLV
jgi:ABC-type lipoprotein release transport system permease subunit